MKKDVLMMSILLLFLILPLISALQYNRETHEFKINDEVIMNDGKIAFFKELNTGINPISCQMAMNPTPSKVSYEFNCELKTSMKVCPVFLSISPEVNHIFTEVVNLTLNDSQAVTNSAYLAFASDNFTIYFPINNNFIYFVKPTKENYDLKICAKANESDYRNTTLDIILIEKSLNREEISNNEIIQGHYGKSITPTSEKESSNLLTGSTINDKNSIKSGTILAIIVSILIIAGAIGAFKYLKREDSDSVTKPTTS